MGCGASSAALPVAAAAEDNATAELRSTAKKPPRTRRSSVEAIEQSAGAQTADGGDGGSKKARGRRSSVEELKALQASGSDEDEVPDDESTRLQPSGAGRSVKDQRLDRRRGSVEQEHAALAALAAAAESGKTKKKKKKKKKSKDADDEFLKPVNGVETGEFDRTKLSDLKSAAVLGVGTFSRVSLCKHKRTGKTYALKKMDKATVDKLKQRDHIMNEKAILQEMQHPFIIRLHATFKDSISLYMVTELVLGGELFSVLTREEYLEEKQAQFYVGCIVLAIEALHVKNNIYRDLKPENILLDSQGYVKVCDFGFAKKLNERSELTRTTCGTPEYVSPEMLSNKEGHGKPTDWWCVGILIYECLFATTPFSANDYSETYNQISRYAAGHVKIDYKCDGVVVTKECKHLMTGLLDPDPSRRLSATAVKKHQWFKSMDWDALYQKKVTPPWVPTVRNAEDASNFESEEYAHDNSSKVPYKGETEWFADF